MRINTKYLIRHVSNHPKAVIDEHGDRIINQALRSISEAMQEGVNYAQEITSSEPHQKWPPGAQEDQERIEISCVVLHPDVFRHMVEKIDYHDPYYMDLILPDLSTIEQ